MTLACLLAQQHGLNAAGWTLMLGCIGMVLGLAGFCFYRILRSPSDSTPRDDVDPDTRDPKT